MPSSTTASSRAYRSERAAQNEIPNSICVPKFTNFLPVPATAGAGTRKRSGTNDKGRQADRLAAFLCGFSAGRFAASDGPPGGAPPPPAAEGMKSFFSGMYGGKTPCAERASNRPPGRTRRRRAQRIPLAEKTILSFPPRSDLQRQIRPWHIPRPRALAELHGVGVALGGEQQHLAEPVQLQVVPQVFVLVRLHQRGDEAHAHGPGLPEITVGSPFTGTPSIRMPGR